MPSWGMVMGAPRVWLLQWRRKDPGLPRAWTDGCGDGDGGWGDGNLRCNMDVGRVVVAGLHLAE